MNVGPYRFTWKAAGLLGFAVLVTYVGTIIVRDAAKEIGMNAGALALLTGVVAHRLPPPPEQA